MKAVVSGEMKKIDKEAESIYGIPGLVLMENAGLKVYKHIIEAGGGDNKVCFVCGTGNNGGDGFAAARHLSFANRNIVIYVLGDGSSIKGDAYINYKIALNMKLDIHYINGSGDYQGFIDDVRESAILVDGILGTGTSREVLDLYRDVIDIINEYANYVISIDIPSGIDADTGKVLGAGVRADRTVTLALPKVGLYTYPGASYAGEVFTETISIPDELIEKQDIKIDIIECEDVCHLLKKRDKDSNKGTYGRAYIVAGSKNMMGAAAMCIMAALRCGAGIVEAAVPNAIKDNIASLVIEAMVHGLDHEDGVISPMSTGKILQGINKASAYALGPGLSQSDGLFELVKTVIENAICPGVIDADGLNLISRDVNILKGAKAPLIITPHPGEMVRLIGTDTKYVQQNRISCARDFAAKYNVYVLLKGAYTVIASPGGSVHINTTGNPGMAKGGSGDVLTGMIASFLAQGMAPFDAATFGAYAHGLAGDMACGRFGEYGMKAGDIIDFIPCAIGKVSQGDSYLDSKWRVCE